MFVFFSTNIILTRIRFLTWNTSGAKSCYLLIIKFGVMLLTFNYDISSNFLSCLCEHSLLIPVYIYQTRNNTNRLILFSKKKIRQNTVNIVKTHFTINCGISNVMHHSVNYGYTALNSKTATR